MRKLARRRPASRRLSRGRRKCPGAVSVAVAMVVSAQMLQRVAEGRVEVQVHMGATGGVLEGLLLLARVLVLGAVDVRVRRGALLLAKERVGVLVLVEEEQPDNVDDGRARDEASRGVDERVEGRDVSRGAEHGGNEEGGGTQRAERRLDRADGRTVLLIDVNLLQLEYGEIEAVQAEARDDEEGEEGRHRRREPRERVGRRKARCGDEDGDGKEPEVDAGDATQAEARGEEAEASHAGDARESAGGTEGGEGGRRQVARLQVGGEYDAVRREDGEVEQCVAVRSVSR